MVENAQEEPNPTNVLSSSAKSVEKVPYSHGFGIQVLGFRVVFLHVVGPALYEDPQVERHELCPPKCQVQSSPFLVVRT